MNRKLELTSGIVGFGALGVAGLLVTLLLAIWEPNQAGYSYLTAFAVFAGIGVASLILLAAFHASHAAWMTVLRRPLEAAASSIAICALLFIPIAIAVKPIFPWVHPHGDFTPEEMAMIVHKQITWLTVPFFLVRTAVYFVIWIVFAGLLRYWSLKSDVQPERAPRLLVLQRMLSAASIPLVSLALTFAAFDWLMSLEPLFTSTVFGVYYFAGSFLAAIAVQILAVSLPPGRREYRDDVNAEHLNNLGSLLFAFVVFWAYIAFSQVLLDWVADLPLEVSFYTLRGHAGWLAVSILLIVCHFGIPFFALLPRAPKRRRGYLAFWALWLLAFHYVDVYWLVMPVLHHDDPTPHVTDLTALVGVGGIVIAFALLTLQGHPALPVGDPTLEESRRYIRA